MSHHPEIPMEEGDNRQQEQDEHQQFELWLDELEQDKIKNLDKHLNATEQENDHAYR